MTRQKLIKTGEKDTKSCMSELAREVGVVAIFEFFGDSNMRAFSPAVWVVQYGEFIKQIFTGLLRV